MYKKFLVIFVVVASMPAHAVTVGTNNSGFDLGVGFFFNGNLSVTSYYDGPELRATFSYRLAGVSSFNSQVLDGWLNVDVAQSYDLNEDEHEIRVGFSDINPSEVIASAFFTTSNGDDLPEYFSWYVSTDGLVNNSAGMHRGEFPDQTVTGDLWFEQGSPDAVFGDSGVFLCIECGFDMTLDFLFMDFSDGTLALNFLDDRQSVILANDFFDGNEPYGFDLNLTAVPVPAAWVLLGSAFMFLAGRRRQ